MVVTFNTNPRLDAIIVAKLKSVTLEATGALVTTAVAAVAGAARADVTKVATTVTVWGAAWATTVAAAPTCGRLGGDSTHRPRRG